MILQKKKTCTQRLLERRLAVTGAREASLTRALAWAVIAVPFQVTSSRSRPHITVSE
jgi:hypothetical protein